MSQLAEKAPLRKTISAFIVCMNEERDIRRALESVKWCDEIVIVDSGSTDKTLDICKEYTDRIFQRPWPGYVEQKRFALSQCRCEWILNIDADEEVSSELKTRILSILESSDDATANGYYINRLVNYLGRWWRKGGWYPEYRLRLCKRELTTWGGTDPHEKAVVNGRTARIGGDLYHYTYTGIHHQIEVLNKYSSNSAQFLQAKPSWRLVLDAICRPPSRFIKFYLLKLGFLEGFAGFLVAINEAFYTFLKYVKAWELKNR